MEIEYFLLEVSEIGRRARDEFIQECINDSSRITPPIKRQRIRSLETQSGQFKVTSATEKKLVTVTMARDLFGRILFHALQAKADMAQVLNYPLTPVPLSLCHPQGTTQKTPKSKLFVELHMVFDKTITPSIKDCERNKRGSNRMVAYQKTGQEQKRPINWLQYQLFMLSQVAHLLIAREGGLRPLKVLEKNENVQLTFVKLSEWDSITEEEINDIENFVSTIYGKKKFTSVDEVRLDLFLKKYQPKHDALFDSMRKTDTAFLPPRKKVLIQNIKRSIYVARLWRNCFLPNPPDQDVESLGWKFVEDGHYTLV